MMDELMKALSKKGESSDMSPEEKKAKMEVVMELLQMAQEAMGDNVKNGLDGMQKVEVMAPNKAKLSEGLDMASDIVDKGPEALMEHEKEETPEEEKVETPEMEMAEEKAGVESEHEEDEEDSKKKPKKKPLFNMFD